MSTTATNSQWKHPFDSYRQERRWTTIIALLIAVVIHLGFIVVAPREFFKMPSTYSQGADEVELTLMAVTAPTPDELKFVEANPDAPENEPDRQDQYSFRNQQAASETSSDVPLEAPNVDGDSQSQKIIEGSLNQAPPLSSGRYLPPNQLGEGEGPDGGKAGEQAQFAPSQSLPKPAFIEQEPVAEGGPGSRLTDTGKSLEVAQSLDLDAPIDLYRKSQQSPTLQQKLGGDGSGGNPNVKPVPRERPRLDPELIQGPLMSSRGSTRIRGALAIDATFSEFGEYQQQFYAALEAGWYQEIEFHQPIDTSTSVKVQFTIQANGEVKNVEVIHSSASEIASLICEKAIKDRSPYRPWTREMVKVFGEERTLRVEFNYR